MIWAGRYGDVFQYDERKISVFAGALLAAAIAVFGLAIGLLNREFVIVTAPFRTTELELIWSVHATVISLTLVALSFAWNSIRQLPTTDEIINELIYRLRSLETISFLLASNLVIGFGIFFSSGDFVGYEIASIVIVVLISTFTITLRRFWYVLDILLHQSLDSNVSEFAEFSLENELLDGDTGYGKYIEHFVINARDAIEKDRPEALRENLNQVEDLLQDLLWHESEDEEIIWDDVSGNLLSLHRRSLQEQNPELERGVLASFAALVYIARNNNRYQLIGDSIWRFPNALEQSFQHEYESEVESLLSRFENVQFVILGIFSDASDIESLERSKSLVNTWLQVHAALWKETIENEARGPLGYLNYLMENISQFRSWEYTNGINHNDEFLEEKQDVADEYAEEVSHLKFASFGWILHLYSENAISEDFLNDAFTAYLDRNFSSLSDFSEAYSQMLDGDEILSYWEGWNMQRELDQTYGAATTGMAVNTWLLRFYCSGIIWSLKGEDLEILPNAERSEFLDYDIKKHRVETIISTLEEYEEDESNYPLHSIDSAEPPIVDRCAVLTGYFEDVKETLEEQEQEEIRELPISDDEVDRFTSHITSQLENTAFRTALQFLSNSSQPNSDHEFEEFTRTSYVPRRVFVDNDVPTYFSSSHTNLIDEYRRFVLDRLGIDEITVEIEDIPDALEGHPVELLLVEIADVGPVIRDDPRSESKQNNKLNSYTEFDGIPVLEDATTEYAALAFYDTEIEYREPEAEYPFEVEVIPGEAADNISESDFNDVRDWVEVQVTYRASITSSEERDGVLFRQPDS